MSAPIILTGASAEYAALEAITLPNKQAYCQRHGYVLERLDMDGFDWKRLVAVYQRLCTTDAEFVAWIDCDAIITNPDFPIEEIIGAAAVVLASDIHGVNSGVFVAKNCEEAKVFFYAVLGMGPKYFPGWAGDQRALDHFAPVYASVWVMVQRWMNSYRYRESCSDIPAIPEGEWQEGDFILHLAGVPYDRKLQIAAEVLNVAPV